MSGSRDITADSCAALFSEFDKFSELELKVKQEHELYRAYEDEHGDATNDWGRGGTNPYRPYEYRLLLDLASCWLAHADSQWVMEWYDFGLILVNNKFIYSVKSGKWRVLGKGKWYRSKSFEEFLTDFVSKSVVLTRPESLETPWQVTSAANSELDEYVKGLPST